MAKAKFVTSEQIDAEIAALEKLREDQPAVIVKFIDGLGNTADKIAAKLRKRGIRAEKGAAEKCALAVALVREFGIKDVSVGGSHSISVDGYEVEALNSDAVDAFIGKFDDGEYPFLLKGGKNKKGSKK